MAKKSAKTSLPFKPYGKPQNILAATPLAAKTKAAAPAKKPATIADVKKQYTAPAKLSKSNAINSETTTLQTFTLDELAQFTKEGAYSTNASNDVHLFYVGRDNVHEILK